MRATSARLSSVKRSATSTVLLNGSNVVMASRRINSTKREAAVRRASIFERLSVASALPFMLPE
jgi:hypothetical protein